MFDKQVEEHHLSFQKLITVLVPIAQEVCSRIMSKNYLITGQIKEDL